MFNAFIVIKQTPSRIYPEAFFFAKGGMYEPAGGESRHTGTAAICDRR